MQYYEAVNFLFDLRRFRMKPGTESVRDLLSHLGDPQDGIDVVQVAGSNGKGSTARMTESVLRESGARVGLYTSPHVHDVRERIRVDGRTVPKRAVTEFVEEVKPYLVDRAADGDPLTFFEALTALAIWWFDRDGVEVAVLEVGMGGEYDATSAVDPVAAAVTTVSLEHTSVLGDTVSEIAATKARIAVDGVPLVTAATGEALATVREVAGDVVTVGEATDDGSSAPDPSDRGGSVPDVTVRYLGRVNHTESRVAVAGTDWSVEARLPLLGSFQARNAGVAVALARQVGDHRGTPVSGDDVARGLRSAHWPGRAEVMNRDPLVLFDGAHNPGASEQLAAVLDEFDYDDLHLVFGAMHDKDHRRMVEALPRPTSVVTCRPNVERAEDPEVLARVFEDAGTGSVSAGDAVPDAVRTALDRAESGDCVLVTGSLYCVAEARDDWVRLEVPKTIRHVDDADAVLARADVPERDRRRARPHGVHRVVRTRVRRRAAGYLTETMRAVGGEAATSGNTTEEEPLDVVLMGTLAQFERLVEDLATAPYGLATVGEAVAERVGLGDGPSRHGYPWEDGPAVMGVLNVTPDSFHDGGEYFDPSDAIERAEAMIDAGADVIDVGGESTRPGADPVPAEEETARVLPVIEAVADLDVRVSIDTRKAAVGRAALDAGADILNDVTGLEDPEMRFLAAEYGVPTIVMHSIDAPVVPGKDVAYDDVVGDVIDELRERVLLAEKAGLPREKVIVDPGLGFGKSKPENFELLGRLDEFRALGCPVLVGHSHKSMFEHVGRAEGERLQATVAATALAVERGADVVRVHDVEENVAAVRVVEAATDPDGFSLD